MASPERSDDKSSSCGERANRYQQIKAARTSVTASDGNRIAMDKAAKSVAAVASTRRRSFADLRTFAAQSWQTTAGVVSIDALFWASMPEFVTVSGQFHGPKASRFSSDDNLNSIADATDEQTSHRAVT